MVRAAPATRGAPRGILGVTLLIAAAFLFGLYRIADGTERHAYNSGAIAATEVRVSEGNRYSISIPGGLRELARRGILEARCTYTVPALNVGETNLPVTLGTVDDRNVEVVGTFNAPVTASIHIDCAGWGAVYVDDSDGAAGDLSGLLLLLGTGALTAGACCCLSSLYRLGSDRAAREQRQVGA